HRRRTPSLRRASGNQDRAAVVAVCERLAARPLDLLRLDGRNREVTALAGGAEEARHACALRLGAAALVLTYERRVDAGRELVARGALGLHLGDDPGLRAR